MKKNNKSENTNLRKNSDDFEKNEYSFTGLNLSKAKMQILICELELQLAEQIKRNEELNHLIERTTKNTCGKYVKLYDFMPSGYFILSRKGEILDLNLCSSQMLGKDLLHFNNNLFEIFVSNDEKNVFNQFLEKVFRSHQIEYCEVKLINAKDIPLFVYMSGIVAKNGKQCYVSMVDITERKQTVKALRQNGENYRQIINGMNDTAWVIGFDGLFIDVNKRAVEVLGYSRDELLLMGPKDIDSKLEVDQINELILHMPTDKIQIFESEHITKEGKKIPVEISSSLVTYEGESAILSIARDITERKLAEEILNQSHAKYQAIFESTGTATFIIEEDMTISMMNHECLSITGYKPESLIGKKWTQFVAPESMQKMIRNHNLRRNNPSLAPKQYDVKLINKKGETRIAILNVGMMPGNQQSIVSIVDITEYKLVLEQLSTSQQIIEGIINEVPIRIFWKDKNLVYLGCNTAFARDAGFYDPKDIIGKDDFQMVWSDQAELYRYDDLQVIENGLAKLHIEEPQKTPEGNIITLLTNKIPLRNTKGEIIGVLGTYMDITELKRIEDDLRASKAILHTIIHTIPDLIWLKDSQGIYISCNAMFERYFGTKEAEIVGKTDYDFVNQELADFFRDNDRRAMEAGKATINEEFITFADDGHNAILEAIKTPMYDSSRNLIGVLGIGRDITERKKALEALQKSEERYRNLFENLPIGIYQTTPDGRILTSNPALVRMLGFSSFEELSKRNLEKSSYTAYSRSSFKEQIERDGNITGLESEWFKCDKTSIIVWEKARVVRDENGKILYYEGIIEDITERKRMEKELIDAKEKAEESNHLKSAFLSTMNHELRTPINHILGFSDIILSLTNDKEIKDYATIIQSSGTNLLSLIEDIFDLANTEQGNIKIKKHSFKGIEIFLENKNVLKEILNDSLKANQINLVYKPDSRLLQKYLTADKNKVNQVLLHIFKNAVKFTKKGFIEFGLSQQDKDHVIFYVKDSGIGIPADKLEIIFECFRQLDDSHSRLYEGTGIGLAIAKRIAEAMNANIWVESEINSGTTFFFNVPMEIADNEVFINESEKEIAIPDLTGKTILIVEDDRESMKLVKIMLGTTNSNIVEAENGQEAIEKVIEFREIDLILIDLKMPVLDGYKATSYIKSIRTDLPIIANTAYSNTKEKKLALEAGCDDIIVKPIDKRILYALLKKYLVTRW